MAAIKEHLATLEADNAILKIKVAELEPCLCLCDQEEQPIIVEDGEREESSPSSYQTPPIASPNKNKEPLPVRIMTMREGQLVPVVNQEEIDELFWVIDQEREVDHEDQEELLVHSPNHQQRLLQVKCQAQPSHCMSMGINLKPWVPLQRIDGAKGALWQD